MKSIFVLFCIILIIIDIGTHITFKRSEITKGINSEEIDINEQNQCKDSYSKDCKLFPWLDLSTRYFSESDVQWGLTKEKTTQKTMDRYDQIAIKNKSVYQSYPTTNTKIENYSNEVVPLKIKKIQDLRKENQEMEPNGWLSTTIEENYIKYGQLATNYLPGKYIQWIDEFDVDSDGTKEKIVMSNFSGSADSGSYNADIIKGNKIIFSVTEGNASIITADTPNGFLVEWKNPDDQSPHCCETGFMRTRFVLENGKFIPLYEQEIRYIIVGNNPNSVLTK